MAETWCCSACHTELPMEEQALEVNGRLVCVQCVREAKAGRWPESGSAGIPLIITATISMCVSAIGWFISMDFEHMRHAPVTTFGLVFWISVLAIGLGKAINNLDRRQ